MRVKIILTSALLAACASGPIRSGGDRPGWISSAASDPRYPRDKFVAAVGTTSVGQKSAADLLASLDAAARAEVANALASTISAEVKSYESVRTRNGQTQESLSAEQRVSQVVKDFDLTAAIEIPDRWREGDTAYAFAVLDKQKALSLQQGKVADHARLAQELVAQGDSAAAPAEALRSYARARSEADAALSGVLLLRALGGKAELAQGAAQAEARLSALAGKLVLEVAGGNNQRVQQGKALPQPVVFAASIDGKPATGLPLVLALPGGRDSALAIGPDGKASARVDDVGKFDKPEQRIVAAVDWARLSGVSAAPVWVAGLPRKEAVAVAIQKSVHTTRVLVMLRESVEGGAPLADAPVQAALINALSGAGFDVKDGKVLAEKIGADKLATVADSQLKLDASGMADVIVVGSAVSRHAGNFGATTVWHKARAEVRVIDLATGQVLLNFDGEEKGKRPGEINVAGRSALDALAAATAPKLVQTLSTAVSQ